MFRLLGVAVAVLHLLLCRHFARRLSERFPRRAKGIRRGAVAVFLLLSYPALLMSVGSWWGIRLVRASLPEWLLMFSMGAQVAALLCGVFLLLGALWALVLGLGRHARGLLVGATSPRRIPGADGAIDHAAIEYAASGSEPGAGRFEPKEPPERVDQERRRIVLAGSAVVPILAFGASTAGVFASRQRPVLTRIRLPVRREMTNLHGVTIAQVSDLHVGTFMDADRLDEIRDAMNAAGADYHVITGDLLDNHISQLELSARFVRGLRPRRGEVFFCMGNHEYYAARSADVPTLVRGLVEAGAQVLVDEARRIRVGGDGFWMGAIDYPPRRRPGEVPRRPTSESLRLALGQMRDDGAPRILLSHHPRTFVEARELPIDLMLAGHTHGGQIKLGRVGDVALTPALAYEFYHNGLYEHHGRRLYVNAGAGGWLPVRINCPPEIALVELSAA